jgi:hypothetical protein
MPKQSNTSPLPSAGASHEYKTKRASKGLEFNLVLGSAIATAFIAGLAMLALLPEDGVITYLKTGFIGTMAGVVSYAVNRFAIDRGAPQAATGFALAGVLSVGTILFVGAGLFASTYAGLTIGPVNELRLQEYGQSLGRYISDRNASAIQATRTIPVVKGIAAEWRNKVECEASTACLSGRGGGIGRVTRAAEVVAERADSIASQLQDGDVKRQSLIARLNDLQSAFQKTLGDTSVNLNERRPKLSAIVGEIDQALSNLDEALPTSVLSAYASELKSGISITGRPAATTTANSILLNQGRSLEAVLGSLGTENAPRPVFPALAGVSSTFVYIGHFLPIAAIVAVIELILPLTLWVYAFIGIAWEKEQRARQVDQTPLEASKSAHAQKDNVTALPKARARRSNRHQNRSVNRGEM